MPVDSPIPVHVAAHIVQRVGEAGQPPEYGVEHVQVGFDSLLDMLALEYIDPIAEAGRSSAFKIVQSYFGGGKSLFLRCVRGKAWSKGLCAAIVGLTPQESPFDDSRLIYKAVAAELTWPPADPYAEPTRGIDEVLRVALEDLRERLGVDGLRAWIGSTLRRQPVDSRSYRTAVVAFARAWLDGDEAAEDLAADWLRGDRVPSREAEKLGIREEIDKTTGFRMLRSLVQMSQVLGGRGLLLCFDELDRNMSLPPRRRRSVADNLRELIDGCGTGKLPGLLCMYAVPPEFLRNIVPEYPALQQRLEAPHPMCAESPLSPLIDLEDLGMSPTDLLTAIGLRLATLVSVARHADLDLDLQRENLETLADEIASASFEVAHRRAFVKAAIDMLLRQVSDEHAISVNELRELAGEGADLIAFPGGDALEEF